MRYFSWIILGSFLSHVFAANVQSLKESTQTKISFTTEIKKAIESIHRSQLDDPVIGDVVQFYEARNYQPYWHVRHRWSIRAENALGMMDKAFEEGLFPENYAQAKTLIKGNPLSLEQKAQQEILFCCVVFRYLLDLTGNRFNAKELRHHTAMAPQYQTPATLIDRMDHEDESGSWMNEFSIEIDQYQALKDLLAQLRQQQKEGKSWGNIDNGPPLKFSHKGQRVIQLRGILSAQGDFKDSLDAPQFDTELETALKHFQKRHGLAPNGVVDEPTRRFLNFSLDERIRRVIVTMERWRWLPSKLPSRYVWVNIPSFQAEAISYNKTILKLPMIVGRFYNKTPVFASQIHQIRINPRWTAPHEIAVKHILPKFQKDPQYFHQKGFILLSKDRTSEIDPQTIQWSDYSEDHFPFVLRQKEGPDNALGRIRFSIKNPWQIYLHSTPEIKLFDAQRRMFSSGCVRLKNPEKLAAFVLDDSSRWSESIILQMMKNNERRFLELKTITPVFLVYFTVWVHNKTPHFVEDIYKKDTNLDFIIHSLESKEVRYRMEDLQKPRVEHNLREISQEAAKEIFVPTSASTTTLNKS